MRGREDATASQEGTTALLAPTDVAEVLGVSLATVKRLTATGELPHVRVSDRRPRYAADDVAGFIAARRSAGLSTDDDPAGTGSSASTPAEDGGGCGSG
jgi:excisionase family DNA binding protein